MPHSPATSSHSPPRLEPSAGEVVRSADGAPREARSSARLAMAGRLLTLGALASLAVVALLAATSPVDRGHIPTMLAVLTGGLLLGAAGLILSRRAGLAAAELWAVEGAMRAYAAGERDGGALRLDSTMGSLASAWNDLLAERDASLASGLCRRAEANAAAKEYGADVLNASFESINQGILILDADLRVTRCNGAARVLMGLAEHHDTSGELQRFIGEPSVLEAARAAGEGERRPDPIEIERDEESGFGVLRFSFRPLRRSDRAAALVLIEDVTQRRLAERARDSFVAQATHELRTPLTNIRLYVEEALEDDGDDARVRLKALEVISRESRRLERTIADMLSVSEIEAGTLSLRASDVRLEPLFEELRDEFEPQARDKNIELVFDLPPKFPVAVADRDKLVLAVHNIVGNAIKYTPAGGRVGVTVTADERTLEVVVSDTGIGISAADLPNVFDRFYRASDERLSEITGSGLGLALAREVVRMHGGEIRVESELNRGSVFTLTVPIAPAERAAAA